MDKAHITHEPNQLSLLILDRRNPYTPLHIYISLYKIPLLSTLKNPPQNYEVPHCGAFSTPHLYPSWNQIITSGSCFHAPKIPRLNCKSFQNAFVVKAFEWLIVIHPLDGDIKAGSPSDTFQ